MQNMLICSQPRGRQLLLVSSFFTNLRMLCLRRSDAASHSCLSLAANLPTLAAHFCLKGITIEGALYPADANGFTFTTFEPDLVLELSRQPVWTRSRTPLTRLCHMLLTNSLADDVFLFHRMRLHGVRVTHTTRTFPLETKDSNVAGGVDGGQLLVQPVQAQGLDPMAESIQSRLVVQTG